MIGGNQMWGDFSGENGFKEKLVVGLGNRWLCSTIIIIWACAVLFSFTLLVAYSQTAGLMKEPPSHLVANPVKSVQDESWQLTMAVHPKCACTRASVAELERIVAKTSANLQLRFLVYIPAASDDSWSETTIIDRVESLPQGLVEFDVEGRAAKQLGMHTSGSVVLSDSEGGIHYYGGITMARNHEGDSAGKQAILMLLRGESSPIRSAPVFGCSL